MEQRYILNAIDAALQAGADILAIYNDPASDFEIERKADNSPLTIADRKAHETITGFLCNTPFPFFVKKANICPMQSVPDGMLSGLWIRWTGLKSSSSGMESLL